MKTGTVLGGNVPSLTGPRGRRQLLSPQAVSTSGDPAASAGGRKRGPTKNITLVDPLVAKRLALDELKEIRAKEQKKRWREVEAVNGAWAILGLTSALIGEGVFGTGILGQVSNYLEILANALDSLAT